jgi:hypothetical protein
VRRIGKNFFDLRSEEASNRRARRMPPHGVDQINIERVLYLVLLDLLNAVDQTSPISGVEYDLGVNPTEPEIDNHVGLREPDRELSKLCFGSDGLAMTGNDSRTLGHWAHPIHKY